MINQNISQETNTHVLVLCLVIAIVFVTVRGFARYFKLQQFPSDAEDIAIYIALASFVIMTSLYLAAMSTYYPVELVSAGLIPPYASMMEDLTAMLHEFFAVQIFFWLTLWAVKCSLLLMFQRLTTGIQSYTRIWWGVMIFTILTFAGCVVSQFTSCSSMHAWFTAGLCETPADNAAKAASLWYSLAVDLLTDLMIMIVPIQILYNLQISTGQKLSVGVVFCVGLITMVFAIVRVISLDTSVRATGQVSTTWLILWASLEGAVAIIVGCLPAFAVFIRGRVEASRSNFSRTPKNSSPSSNSISMPGTSTLASTRAKASLARARIESISLNDIEAAAKPPTRSLDGESRKGLVERDGITVTQAWTQKWHEGESDDFEREKNRKLGLNGVAAL